MAPPAAGRARVGEYGEHTARCPRYFRACSPPIIPVSRSTRLPMILVLPRKAGGDVAYGNVAVSTRILGRTMRDAIRNNKKVEKAPYAYPKILVLPRTAGGDVAQPRGVALGPVLRRAQVDPVGDYGRACRRATPARTIAK